MIRIVRIRSRWIDNGIMAFEKKDGRARLEATGVEQTADARETIR
ncbi:MAG TPA: hypothetical protein PK843_17725 [bacterium]|nr:hypothetical protein [bacterium]